MLVHLGTQHEGHGAHRDELTHYDHSELVMHLALLRSTGVDFSMHSELIFLKEVNEKGGQISYI